MAFRQIKSLYIYSMKSLVVFAGSVILALFACQTATTEVPAKQEVLRDSLENELITTISTINDNLELIRKKQGLIGTSGSDAADQKASILQNIQLINALLADNDKQISVLNQKVNALGQHNSALKRLAAETLERITRQLNEILQLKQDLAMEEFKVADLSVKMDEIQVENERLETEKKNLEALNAQYDKNEHLVFITYGTEKDLSEKGLLQPTKGLKNKKPALSSTFNRNRAYFSEEDLRLLKEIPLSGRNPKLLTLHPEDSYRIETTGKDYCKIILIDQDAFWSVSHFLVVCMD